MGCAPSSTATSCWCRLSSACASGTTPGEAIPKIDDGPWPAFPADLTSIALAVATQAEGTVLIFEKMFENRLFFVDKLTSMGARIVLCDPHRAIVSGPSRLHGERMESPDIRAGMAMLIASLCAEGVSEIGNVGPDRSRLRAHRRAAARPRRADPARLRGPRPDLVPPVRGTRQAAARVRARKLRPPMTYPIPPGTRDILPDEMSELRALSGVPCSKPSSGYGYGEVSTPTMEYENVLAQGDARAAGASYRLFDEHGQVLALRSDMTIPIARLVATRYEGAAAAPAVLLPLARLPVGAARSAASSASSSRPASS